MDGRPTPAASLTASVTSPRQLGVLGVILASGILAIVITFIPWLDISFPPSLPMDPTLHPSGWHALVHDGLRVPEESGEGEQVTGGGPSGFTTLTAGLLLLGLAALLACTFDSSVPRHVGFLPYPRWVEVTGTPCAAIAVSFLAIALISALMTNLRTTVVVLLVVDTVLAATGAFLALPPGDFR